MRDAADRPGRQPALGEVLSRGDALHSVRHRSRLPLSVGGCLSGDVAGECEPDFRRHGFVSWHLVRRLHLRPEEKGVRLEIVMIKFGTSGWRGLIARDFTFDNVRLASQGIAGYLNSELRNPRSAIADRKPLVILGHDTRFLGREFSLAAAEVLAASGLDPLLCQRDAPTPVIAHAIRYRKAIGGINMTASHNPAEYQGLKLSTHQRAPATPEVTRQIEANIAQLLARNWNFQAAVAGTFACKTLDPQPAYFKQLRRLIDFAAIRKARLKVAV